MDDVLFEILQAPGREPAAWLRGEQKARTLVTVIRASLTAGDELQRAVERLPDDEAPGFYRALQKELEVSR